MKEGLNETQLLILLLFNVLLRQELITPPDSCSSSSWCSCSFTTTIPRRPHLVLACVVGEFADVKIA
jgi:hypothetical protein